MPEALAATGNPDQRPSLQIIPGQTERLSLVSKQIPETLPELHSAVEPVTEIGSLALSRVVETAEQKLLQTELTPEGLRAGMACLIGHTKMIWAGAYLWSDIKLGTLEAKSLALEAPVFAVGSLMVAYSLNWKQWKQRRESKRAEKIAPVTKLPVTSITPLEPKHYLYNRPEDAA